jgi:hypothetical protein
MIEVLFVNDKKINLTRKLKIKVCGRKRVPSVCGLRNLQISRRTFVFKKY